MEHKKSRVHVFRGEDLADLILDWLRRTDRPADDPIERLIRLEGERCREFLLDEEHTEQIVQLVKDTVLLWNPGQVRSANLIGRNDWNSSWKFLGRSPEPMGLLVLDKCLLLKNEDLLQRIRQCGRPGCNEWFFAKFDHQNFHSDECRKAELSADETRKESRRQYMRDLRAKKKIKKFRSPKSKGGE